ncbi:MAG: metallophosphoesterase family protein [Anaerolineae bacterium]|nr:metallophosphoesterase family protein [Anaerolineae bacterium]
MNLDHFAVISDIHGNRLALEAVLQDIRQRQLETIFNLGDHFYGSVDPAGVADILIHSEMSSIAGNQDWIIHSPPNELLETTDHLYMMEQLNADHLLWLRELPATRQLEDVFLCHGTPRSDDTYLLERVTSVGAFMASDAAIRAELADIDATLILCGHSHVSRVVQLSDGKLVVNPGSVGMPAYTDDVPLPHKMEAGSPHARYAILTRTQVRGQNRWQVEQIAVTYDWHLAAEQARRRGRSDRAEWIESGRA